MHHLGLPILPMATLHHASRGERTPIGTAGGLPIGLGDHRARKSTRTGASGVPVGRRGFAPPFDRGYAEGPAASSKRAPQNPQNAPSVS